MQWPACELAAADVPLSPPALTPRLPQGFKATFQKTAFAAGEWQQQLQAPEPAFTMLSVADLLPEDRRAGYEAVGGDLV